MKRADPLQIVEAAYVWEPEERPWLERIADAALPFAIGGGVIASTYRRMPDGHVIPQRVVLAGGADRQHAATIQHFCTELPGPLANALFAPTEFAGNAAWRVDRIARELARQKPARIRQAAYALRKNLLPSMWGIVGGAPEHELVTVMFPAPAERRFAATDPFPRADSRVLGLVAAHLGSALRLRALGADPAQADHADVVLSPKGDIVHVAGSAERSKRVRVSLAEAVMRRERSRGRLRRVDSAEAMRLWTALVGGRWSLVDAVERDGKRFVLARRNTHPTGDLLTLTKEENDVVWLAARGHTLKYVAYELGVSVGWVTRRLASACRKLRMPSRRDLIRRLGHHT